MSEEFKAGAEIEVGHPFVRTTFMDRDGDGEGYSETEKPTWAPGVRQEFVAPDGFDDVADAMGSQILTIVSVHKPGRFPERIFYTRQWRDPDGRVFGKGNLRIKTTQAFRWLVRGYRHEFRIEEPKAQVSAA